MPPRVMAHCFPQQWRDTEAQNDAPLSGLQGKLKNSQDFSFVCFLFHKFLMYHGEPVPRLLCFASNVVRNAVRAADVFHRHKKEKKTKVAALSGTVSFRHLIALQHLGDNYPTLLRGMCDLPPQNFVLGTCIVVPCHQHVFQQARSFRLYLNVAMPHPFSSPYTFCCAARCS